MEVCKPTTSSIDLQDQNFNVPVSAVLDYMKNQLNEVKRLSLKYSLCIWERPCKGRRIEQFTLPLLAELGVGRGVVGRGCRKQKQNTTCKLVCGL